MMQYAKTQTAPGYWHSPSGGGPNYAASMNQWKINQRNSQHSNRTWDKGTGGNAGFGRSKPQKKMWKYGGDLPERYNPNPVQPQQPSGVPNIPDGHIDPGGLGPRGGQAPYPGLMHPGTVNTSITPSNLFTPLDTQMAVNQAAGSTAMDANYLSKSLMRPGMSRNAGTQQAIAGALGQGASQMNQAMTQIPLADALMNDSFRLQGESARSQEGLSLAELMRRMQNTQDSDTLFRSGTGTSILTNLLNGLGV